MSLFTEEGYYNEKALLDIDASSDSEASSDSKALFNKDASSESETASHSKAFSVIEASSNIKSLVENYLAEDLENTAVSLSEILSELDRVDSGCTILTEHWKEIVEIICNICADILDCGDSPIYPGISKGHIDPVLVMLSHLVNCSDHNFELSDIIAKNEQFLPIAIKKIQEWKYLHVCYDVDMKLITGGDILEMICTVVYNISVFEDYVKIIRDENCIKAMKPLLDSKDDTIRLLCLATVANIVNEKESDVLKSNGDVIQFLMSTIWKAIISDAEWDGWSLKELARIVRQVARNDRNKRTVVQYGAVPLLVEIVDKGKFDEKKEAVRALWALSFDKDNRREMIEKRDWKVITTLEKSSRSSNRDLKMLSRKALWTINMTRDNTNIFDEQRDKGHKSKRRHILISYNWGHKTVVEQIDDSLKKDGFKIWRDVHDMYGSTVEAMAHAVEEADIVLICFSSKYKDSHNCRAEAEYAYQLKKKIIPLKMEKNYTADGWLGFILGSMLYYDLSGDYPFADKVNELIRALHKELKEKRETNAVPTTPAVAKTKKDQTGEINSPTYWNHSQVQKWLNDNNLLEKQLKPLTGTDIASLGILVHECPDKFYQTIRELFDLQDMQSMSVVRFAFENIDISKQNLRTKIKKECLYVGIIFVIASVCNITNIQ